MDYRNLSDFEHFMPKLGTFLDLVKLRSLRQRQKSALSNRYEADNISILYKHNETADLLYCPNSRSARPDSSTA